jgi:CheY-like chemotaxis protein
MNRLRVLVADDNDIFRYTMIGLLCEGYHVIGAVCDGEELIQSALCLDPDVVVSDILMPGLNGLAARQMLIAAERVLPFVFVSVLGKELLELQFPQDESAVALVYKGDISIHLGCAVAAVLKGEPYLSPFYR